MVPLFYRNLQAALGRALVIGAQDYSVSVEITTQYEGGAAMVEEPPLISEWEDSGYTDPSIIIETDASGGGGGGSNIPGR